jgi:hypothetical protein
MGVILSIREELFQTGGYIFFTVGKITSPKRGDFLYERKNIFERPQVFNSSYVFQMSPFYV